MSRRLTLALLVPRISTDHAHRTVTPDNLAVLAQLFYRSSYLHGLTL